MLSIRYRERKHARGLEAKVVVLARVFVVHGACPAFAGSYRPAVTRYRGSREDYLYPLGTHARAAWRPGHSFRLVRVVGKKLTAAPFAFVATYAAPAVFTIQIEDRRMHKTYYLRQNTYFSYA
jgi:hypothetical protein